MTGKTDISTLCEAGRQISWRRPLIFFLVFLLAGVVHVTSLAQDSEYEPDEYFDIYLSRGHGLDDIRNMAEYQFGAAVAAEIAVYRCSPDPESYCPGSSFYSAWSYFQELIHDHGYGVDTAVHYMNEYYDEHMVNAIAVHWCSPSPEVGCADSRYFRAWSVYLNQLSNSGNPATAVGIVARTDPMVAEHIAAFECAEPTCYAHEISQLEPDDFAEFKSTSIQSGEQRSSDISFTDRAGKSAPVWRKALCKAKIVTAGC